MKAHDWSVAYCGPECLVCEKCGAIQGSDGAVKPCKRAGGEAVRYLLLLALLGVGGLSGCGLYVHRGGGSYSFIGPGSMRVAKRCSPYAQWSWTSPSYDYSKMGKKE